MSVCVYASACACVFACTLMWAYGCVYVCIYTDNCNKKTYITTHIYAFLYVCICMHPHTYKHILIQKYTNNTYIAIQTYLSIYMSISINLTISINRRLCVFLCMIVYACASRLSKVCVRIYKRTRYLLFFYVVQSYVYYMFVNKHRVYKNCWGRIRT